MLNRMATSSKAVNRKIFLKDGIVIQVRINESGLRSILAQEKGEARLTMRVFS